MGVHVCVSTVRAEGQRVLVLFPESQGQNSRHLAGAFAH